MSVIHQHQGLHVSCDVATLIFDILEFRIAGSSRQGYARSSLFSLKEYGVPDFCQLVLMTTPAKCQETKDSFRKLILAMRKATGLIHQKPSLARKYYYEHVNFSTTDATNQAIVGATFNATLPAFPNDNNMSEDYYQRLMAWLMETKQVDATAAKKVEVSTYWTNEVAW